NQAQRAAVFGRYIFQYGDSLYLPPMHYVEAFAAYQDNFFPFVAQPVPGGERFTQTTTGGIHYRLDYLTPYWDPQGGVRIDAVYEGGLADLANQRGFGIHLGSTGVQKLSGQVSTVFSAPDLTATVGDRLPALRPALEWFADTRLAVRAYG